MHIVQNIGPCPTHAVQAAAIGTDSYNKLLDRVVAVTSPVPVPTGSRGAACSPSGAASTAAEPAGASTGASAGDAEGPEEPAPAEPVPRASTPPLPAVGSGAGSGSGSGSGSEALPPGVDPKVQVARIIRDFLDASASQLTYHGLVELHAKIKERELAVFFRNNHFSTLFKVLCVVWLGCMVVSVCVGGGGSGGGDGSGLIRVRVCRAAPRVPACTTSQPLEGYA